MQSRLVLLPTGPLVKDPVVPMVRLLLTDDAGVEVAGAVGPEGVVLAGVDAGALVFVLVFVPFDGVRGGRFVRLGRDLCVVLTRAGAPRLRRFLASFTFDRAAVRLERMTGEV